MPIDYSALVNSPRLLLEATLCPLQGDRFQSTGFADLGAAIYDVPNADPKLPPTKKLLVESAQSVANHLEQTIWDEASGDLIPELSGLPFIRVMHQGAELSNSILEAHRINSEYIMAAKLGDEPFKKVLQREIGADKKRPVDRKRFTRALFKFDPNSILHGSFLEEIDGRLRVTRAVSGFIEADDVIRADSGGVKINRVEPGLKDGKGNVPYPRTTDFTARRIQAFFHLDLALLRATGLGDDAFKLLTALALLKVRRFLDRDLRLRSACVLKVNDGKISVSGPNGFDLPDGTSLLKDCHDAITAISALTGDAALFSSPAVTPLEWTREERDIEVELPEGAPDPTIPDDLKEKKVVEFKKGKDGKPSRLVIKPDHGETAEELANVLFPPNADGSKSPANEATLRELSACRIAIHDEEVKPKIPKEHKDKTIRWQKPGKGKAGELWIAADIDISGDELASLLFPDDDAAQTLVRAKVQ